jgi:hypothetical protein
MEEILTRHSIRLWSVECWWKKHTWFKVWSVLSETGIIEGKSYLNEFIWNIRTDFIMVLMVSLPNKILFSVVNKLFFFCHTSISASLCLSVRLLHFDFFRTIGPILIKDGTIIFRWRGFKIVQMKLNPLLQWEIMQKSKDSLTFKKQNQEVNFNQPLYMYIYIIFGWREFKIVQIKNYMYSRSSSREDW